MTSLPGLTLAGARRALAGGELCPVDYVEALLRTIEAFDGQFHALTEVAGETALSAASSLKGKRPDRRLPLFGIPFLVKDIIDVEGSVTTCQSRAHIRSPAARNAQSVQRLLDAGAIYLGKTSLDEFALGGPHFDEPWPPARNPWNPAYTPGSSSSGSGAALAAKFAPLALGTDTGGSIRSPAMMCGVVGLKPTFGRLPMQGVHPLAPSLDVLGPMARTVEDVAIAFNCLAGIDGEPEAAPEAAPKLVRLDHLWREELEASEDVATLFDAAMEDLGNAGSAVATRCAAALECFNAAGWVILLAEAFQVHRSTLSAHPDRYGQVTRELLLRGAHVSIADYIGARHLHTELTASVDDCLGDADAIVLPVSAMPPCKLEDGDAMARLAAASLRMICNVTGHPALALPIGLSADGLPVGIQIIGRKHREERLLAVGLWIEGHLSTWVPGTTPSLPRPTAGLPPEPIEALPERANVT
jgi:aspartyl-tRNA(Asn)/glutamyl-tRNA(Gln) amidotransferase subunit A